jgi:transposase
MGKYKIEYLCKMNSKALFELALGDIKPWHISKIEFMTTAENVKTLHIHLDFVAGSIFTDSTGHSSVAYDTSVRTWRHLNFFEHTCYLHAHVPRIMDSTGAVVRFQVPWARSNQGFTLLFEAYVMSLIELEMPVSNVARLVGEYDQRIWNIFHYHVRKAQSQTDYTGITKVGIDETSRKKGHDYVTVGVDLEKRRVFDVQSGKDSAAVAQLGAFLDKNGSPCQAVEQVSIDMSPAFIAGCQTTFEQAAITFDHFHVTKEVNKAVDEVRKLERQEAKELKELKGHKYTFLKNPENLSDKKKIELQNLLTLFPTIGQAYRLKELFREFWSMDCVQKAEIFLKDWCEQVENSKIQPLIKAANTIKAHWSGIINFIQSKINNGILEGINSKIQLTKKRARGFRNKQNFKNMILFIAGKLNLVYPL